MGLKDLIIDTEKASESLIEGIISTYVRYDPEHKKIALLPATRELSNRAKTLLFLVALKGWRFVLKEDVPLDEATPGEIEKATGIIGNSLRPNLRAMVTESLLLYRDGRYSVPTHNLSLVQEQMRQRGAADLPGGGSATPTRARSSKKVRAARASKSKTAAKSTSKVAKSSSGRGLKSKLDDLIGREWFKSGRTLKDLHEYLHTKALLVTMNQLPKQVLPFVRSEVLTRKKEDRDGKSVWVYYQK